MTAEKKKANELIDKFKFSCRECDNAIDFKPLPQLPQK